jgi:hypothetical protein
MAMQAPVDWIAALRRQTDLRTADAEITMQLGDDDDSGSDGDADGDDGMSPAASPRAGSCDSSESGSSDDTEAGGAQVRAHVDRGRTSVRAAYVLCKKVS